jgi:hypothetical protein
MECRSTVPEWPFSLSLAKPLPVVSQAPSGAGSTTEFAAGSSAAKAIAPGIVLQVML